MSRILDLAGCTAIVTGAGSGIGQACAVTLARAGASVLVADVDGSRAVATLASIVDDDGDGRVCVLDVSDFAACSALATASADVDVVVNAAATWSIEPFAESDPATWDRHLAVTLIGMLNVSRAFLPAMIEGGKGSIVSISSDAGRVGQQQQVLYSAAKSGIIGATRSLAVEVARHGIRVNCVAPGLTRTPASKPFIDAIGLDKLTRQYPLGRLGEPGDIADAVLFLASDMSRWITGQVLSVNGGFTTAG